MTHKAIFKPLLKGIVPIVPPVARGDSLVNKTGSWRYMRPVYSNKLPPCNHSCPANEDIQGYLSLVKQGRFQQAWELIRRSNPFPAVLGRVCDHPCELACNRRRFDEAVVIHNVERFLGDYGLTLPGEEKITARREERIAVIGAGPAGLSCAYHLAKMEYRVTVFEALSVPGGMLAAGIPEYRLPKEILAAEISAVERLGIDIQTNVTIGSKQSLDDLLGQGYKAIFIATGAHKSMKLGLSGEEKDGAVDALSFLREVNLGSRVGVGDKVAVIGGNNVAVNAARVAIRLGAKYVSIICQQSKIDMPSRDEEVKAAEEEGVHIIYLASPNNILGEGRVAGLECIRMRLGKADKGQVPRRIPIKGSEFVIDVDTVIIAVGRTPDLTLINHELDTSPTGTLVVDAGTLATNRPGIFAGGDVTGGRATVARAIGAGMRASVSIDRYIRGERFEVSREKTPIAGFKDLNLAYFQSSPGAQISRLPVADRIKGFAEVESGFTESVSVKETERCFSCGVCNSCDNCWLVCPDVAISKKNGEYEVNYDYCKGCGICKEECPRGAITMEEEAKWRK